MLENCVNQINVAKVLLEKPANYIVKFHFIQFNLFLLFLIVSHSVRNFGGILRFIEESYIPFNKTSKFSGTHFTWSAHSKSSPTIFSELCFYSHRLLNIFFFFINHLQIREMLQQINYLFVDFDLFVRVTSIFRKKKDFVNRVFVCFFFSLLVPLFLSKTSLLKHALMSGIGPVSYCPGRAEGLAEGIYFVCLHLILKNFSWEKWCAVIERIRWDSLTASYFRKYYRISGRGSST